MSDDDTISEYVGLTGKVGQVLLESLFCFYPVLPDTALNQRRLAVRVRGSAEGEPVNGVRA